MHLPSCLALILSLGFGLGGCAASGGGGGGGGAGGTGASVGAVPVEAVESLDVEKYLGRWYEIARYPMFFQKDLVGVTAEYSERDDGNIRVVNKGRVKTLDGKEKSATAKAWIPDPAAPAKLKVQFFWPFNADYWVIALDDDYRWAVVGEPQRRYLWILSREPQLDEATEAVITERIIEQGYDLDRLQRTEQAAPAS